VISRNIRVISRLDIKGERLIKGVHLEGLRQVGWPNDYAKRYYQEGIDELLIVDIVASLYGRNINSDVINQATLDVFVPVAAGGGVRTLSDAEELLNAGADKIVTNTGSVKYKELIRELALKYGSQAVVCSIEAKRQNADYWEVYTESGRERSGLSVIEWAKTVQELGAGEIFVTSIDNEGTGLGFDIDLVERVVDAVHIPVVASGGFGNLHHLDAVLQVGVSGVAIADAFHFSKCTVSNVKDYIAKIGYEVRP